MQVKSFYSGLTTITGTLVDASAGGTFMKKTKDEAYELLEDITTNNCQQLSWLSERSKLMNSTGVHEIDAIIPLTTKFLI